ncbi:hypothetical protein D187_006103 [Cystobacter fuscus DSM 2262]|uniref:YARHG domain-containing protein n=1 Tax=Cystobacter fuscus (strain ATCC 25194 / DSM 2262 / NBRC 100088 / M29) TaxID=1242864 RepID=S9QQY3_CYSF2|nr:YARHG domain-containing protein [Cystobacter fuscus]EPX63694.1 hypothetical protein D187_006103 [Cystobacter fuscus DSM 2262]
MRVLVLATLVASAPALGAEPYVPAAARDIPGYSESPLCTPGKEDDPETDDDESTPPLCPSLEGKNLRELSLLRNTIFARYGWAGFRKTWLREHFQKQPWFKPNKNFTYKLLSPVDRENVQHIARYELGFTYQDLEERQDALLSEAGKWWGDVPSYEDDVKGRTVYACSLRGYTGQTEDEVLGHPLGWVWSFEQDAEKSKDCKYHEAELSAREKRQQVDAVAPDIKKLSAEERIELGLISRALGSFASDDASRGYMERSLDEVLSLKDLRELSLRDLRLLRNTIYARRGRPFKSPLLQEHFARMPWYKPDPTYTDARLTKNDQRNAKLIQSVEKELGGALKDEDFLIADPEQRAPDPAFISGA